MYERLFVACKSDVTKLPSFVRFKKRGVRSLLMKNALRIVKLDDLMVLDQINVVDTEASQRFIKLSGSFLFRTSINLGHHKGPVAVTVAQSLAQA